MPVPTPGTHAVPVSPYSESAVVVHDKSNMRFSSPYLADLAPDKIKENDSSSAEIDK